MSGNRRGFVYTSDAFVAVAVCVLILAATMNVDLAGMSIVDYKGEDLATLAEKGSMNATRVLVRFERCTSMLVRCENGSILYPVDSGCICESYSITRRSLLIQNRGKVDECFVEVIRCR
ncbi:MAG: hypothetical protein QXP42_05625 [Candidatus Micrarchaeia archaeon]